MDKYSHRKNTLKLSFKNAEGQPLKGAAVEIRQTGSDFLFGCAGFDVVAYFMAPVGKREALRKRVDYFTDLFNYATLPLYWGSFEEKEGCPKTKEFREIAGFLKEKNITLKGHPLCWHTVCADWLLKYDNETIFKKQLERIHRDAGAFAGLIDMWDVINEVVIMPDFDKYDNAVTRICREKGQVQLVKAVFDAAREANPKAKLLLNDFNTSQAYADLLGRVLDAGVSLDAIGIQSHQHQGYWGREKLEEVLERFSRFGIPLHFTENTFLSGTLIPKYIEDLNDWHADSWPSTPEGEERQVREMTEMYSLLFENPMVEAITNWDFSDGAWLNAPGGLLRRDGSPKPAYYELKRLIKEEWATNTEAVTDEAGRIQISAFKGNYDIIVNGKCFKACNDGLEHQLCL